MTCRTYFPWRIAIDDQVQRQVCLEGWNTRLAHRRSGCSSADGGLSIDGEVLSRSVVHEIRAAADGLDETDVKTPVPQALKRLRSPHRLFDADL